ncbi:hypothetical protein SAMN05216174_108178 [Actinokineospora iranica]|uniref:Uncharacterized protein n=1 Tax=Actinokineospora iranica TaxID=1271860 RepID=A0A1G6SUB3_9PSEU|nr:hypothetical protein SAMN05216174_108178 [Actinokineospora iranica]
MTKVIEGDKKLIRSRAEEIGKDDWVHEAMRDVYLAVSASVTAVAAVAAAAG